MNLKEQMDKRRKEFADDIKKGHSSNTSKGIRLVNLLGGAWTDEMDYTPADEGMHWSDLETNHQ